MYKSDRKENLPTFFQGLYDSWQEVERTDFGRPTGWPARFKDIAAAVTKCSDRVLVERLKELEGDGLVQRVTHTDSALIEYQLTPKGAGLSDVLTAAHAWGDEWLTDEECVD